MFYPVFQGEVENGKEKAKNGNRFSDTHIYPNVWKSKANSVSITLFSTLTLKVLVTTIDAL